MPGSAGAQVRATGDMTTPRLGHTATLLADGSVLVAGGFNAFLPALASAERFGAGRFAATAAMAAPRRDHAAVRLDDGRVLLAGGSTGEGATATAELFDPGQGNFAPTGALSSLARASLSRCCAMAGCWPWAARGRSSSRRRRAVGRRPAAPCPGGAGTPPHCSPTVVSSSPGSGL